MLKLYTADKTEKCCKCGNFIQVGSRFWAEQRSSGKFKNQHTNCEEVIAQHAVTITEYNPIDNELC